jgi:hypothetical protein
MLEIRRYWRVKQGEDSAEIKGRSCRERELMLEDFVP